MAEGARIIAFPAHRMLDREPWVSRRQLAAHLGFSLRWVDLRVRDGMPSMKMRGERRFKVSECERWLEQQEAS